jgi:hypothetical protein
MTTQMMEAHRWEPGDVLRAAEMVGWLTVHGADFYHPSGMGATTTLAIRTPAGELVAQPGDWIALTGAGQFAHCQLTPAAGQFTPGELGMIRDLIETAIQIPGFIDTTSGGGLTAEREQRLLAQMAALGGKASRLAAQP